MQKRYCTYCKINLGLEIVARRADGYHELNTLFVKMDSPSDEISIETSDAYGLTVVGQDLTGSSDNLVTKAFKACSAYKGLPMPTFDLTLTKNIPTGAGLGGGSGDAARAIQIFSELVTPLDKREQFEIAKALGADVPFFLLENNAAIGSGIGDILTPLSLDIPYPILIVKPKNISISTAEAYRRTRLKSARKQTNLREAATLPVDQWKDHIFNDFEEVAFEMEPSLYALKERLYGLGATFALMSGSGSAFFAVFRDEHLADQANAVLSATVGLETYLAAIAK